MHARTICTLLAASALASSPGAYADFQTALKEYKAGHFDLAHRQFLALAQLGDCSSQFNLGAMALEGQGSPQDAGSGVGWLQAAADNGCEQLVGDKAAHLQATLSADEQSTAARIVAHYGRDILHRQGIVNPEFGCPGQTTASVLEAPAPEYPDRTGSSARSAIVIGELTIGADGRARDPEILLAVPQTGFTAAAVESWLNSRYAPAVRDGAPVESRRPAKAEFGVSGGTGLSGVKVYQEARQRADTGEPEAGYMLWLTATVDASLGISAAKATQLLLASARDGDLRAQYWVGSQLRATSACHPQATGVIWLQHAAEGGSAVAQLVLAGDVLAGDPSPAQAAEARTVLQRAASSDNFYAMKHAVALLAASQLDAVRDPGAALAGATRLATGEIQADPQMFEAIAAAYAASGDFRNAVRQQQIAIGKARDLSWNLRLMHARLSAYRGGKPWRGDLFALPPPRESRAD
jgi:hypothetical protein